MLKIIKFLISLKNLIFQDLKFANKFNETENLIFSTAGDGIICRFENAQEAVDTAIEILENLQAFNRTRNRLSMPFILRTGIETGEVIGGKDLSVDQIFSSVVDIAAHIQKNSPPGELTISERVYNQISNKRDFKGPVGEVDGQLIYQSIRSTKN